MRGLVSYSLYVFCLCLALNGARAQEPEIVIEDVLDSAEAVTEEPEPVAVVHPDFEPYSAVNAVFWEQFTEGWRERWKASHAKKSDSDEFSYIGRWAVEEPKVFPGLNGDKGLVVKDKAAHHAITAKFAEPLDNTDQTLVVQYEVKLQNGLECGGAYLKLLTEDETLHAEEFSDKTSYQVMFGPDKCGATNKIHLIIRRKSPITGEYEEKHLIGGPRATVSKVTNLYTLVLNPDQTFEIRVNGATAHAGSLLDDTTFNPAFSPPKEVEDPEDTKPEDWVDEATIPDPNQATKPDDWDEDEPYQIPDPDAAKPEDWDESAEEFIPDPDAEKPDDWDDEEDGEWVASVIPNPECEDHGCGPWTPPTIVNPKFKGKWVQPRIENPDYKGPWKPRKIANPEYYEDAKPADLERIGAIGFELWTMQSDILFDNIYVGHSVEEAEKIGNATYVVKVEVEEAEEKASRPKVEEPKAPLTVWEQFMQDPINFSIQQTKMFYTFFQRDPIFAVRTYPETAAALGIAIVTVLSIFFGAILTLFSSKPAPAPSKPASETETKEETEDVAETADSAATETTARRRTKKN
ncbi:Calreticulin family-domain-containing protein [Lipomyces tetrasporus]|uniref:Calreticulin family-domain-containing protein n=1 Tax=Lipomyces tetrasporus TaxID=54092 RepID=A0AAD7QZ76_9ASCO|nr:Calreticulin family-domain-containing protein [Lipomyces tetrasporus]KAJ8103893.1 Calreticulin family-domain-containing protein [Lipomyces tetrasporus]